MRFRKPARLLLSLLFALGVTELFVVIMGLLLTRNTQLWPALIVGVGDTLASAMLLWAVRRLPE
jgi:hypothetical protein